MSSVLQLILRWLKKKTGTNGFPPVDKSTHGENPLVLPQIITSRHGFQLRHTYAIHSQHFDKMLASHAHMYPWKIKHASTNSMTGTNVSHIYAFPHKKMPYVPLHSRLLTKKRPAELINIDLDWEWGPMCKKRDINEEWDPLKRTWWEGNIINH